MASSLLLISVLFFFFNDTATTEIYTLSLHDALLIPEHQEHVLHRVTPSYASCSVRRSEEHTSELQSLAYLVCRLLLEKKKKKLMFFIFYKKKKKKTYIQ